MIPNRQPSLLMMRKCWVRYNRVPDSGLVELEIRTYLPPEDALTELNRSALRPSVGTSHEFLTSFARTREADLLMLREPVQGSHSRRARWPYQVGQQLGCV